jgi:hypothetical protein
MDSGIYNASDNLVRKLPEEGISLQYYPTSLPASPTPLNPFQRASTISDIKYVMGPDEGDLNGAAGFGPATGKYRINQDQYDKNIFGFNISGHSGKDLVSRYYFMDDVDDFDGFREEREIYPGIIATFYISVMGVYGNKDDYSVTYDDTGGNPVTKTITQNRYDIMNPIALEGTAPNITLCGIDFSDAGNPTDAAQENGTAYYMQTLFKKVTVKATWEFPPGSGTIKTIVLDGGRVNPEATA